MHIANKSRAQRIASPGLIREYLSDFIGIAAIFAFVIIGCWVTP